MRALRRERGSATLEIAILGPALLLLVFVVVQVALWAHARSLALAAAQEGAGAAAAYGARPGDGPARARAFLRDSGGDSIGEVGVAATRDTTTARVEVWGRSLSVLPGVPGIRVVQSAEAPRERFVPDVG